MLLALPVMLAPHAAHADCIAPCVVDLGGSWLFTEGNLRGADQVDPRRRLPDSAWQPMRVPSNWYLEGVDIAGVGWLRRSFASPALDADGVAVLRFAGVDYFTDAWLNGVHLGSHEGYFEPFAFDVTRLLRRGGVNELVVRVDSPLERPADWSLRKRLIKGIFGHHDTRPGGAWSPRGQDANTGGIWNKVTLQLSRRVAVTEPRVRARATPDGFRARVSLRVAGDGRAMAVDATRVAPMGAASGDTIPRGVEADVSFTPHNFEGRSLVSTHPFVLQPGGDEASLDVDLPGAKAWWPRDLGAANLYRVTVTLRQGARVLDRVETITGLREVRVDLATMQWHVNGTRLFLRGTNYIPTQWLAEMSRTDYQRDVQMMTRAHVNMVRVHAHVGDPAFYRVCDEAGMLVWQDFPLQWGYSDGAEFQAEAQRQAQAMVRLLDNHPSILAWSLHNEPPWDAWWMKFKYPDYNPEQNRALDERLLRVVRLADDTRYVHRASATSEHQWQGWYSGHWTDFNKPTTHALVSEFGAQALPAITSLRRIFNDDEIFPDNPKKLERWQYHNFQPDETFKNAKIEKGANIHEFIANSQGYQARLVQLAAESLRRQKYKPVGGIFQFMFVENWPSINWGIVDYWRVPKPGYDALARAYQPLLPSIEWGNENPAAGSTPTFGLWLVNDHQRAFEDLSYEWRLSCGAAELAGGTLAASVDADVARLVRRVVAPALPAGACRVATVVRDAAARTLAQNHHDFFVR